MTNNVSPAGWYPSPSSTPSAGSTTPRLPSSTSTKDNSSPPAPQEVLSTGRLRRAQASHTNTPAGLNITRSLITDKLRGQTAIHTTLTGNDQPAAFTEAFDTIRTANNREDLRAAEAKAARAYWQTIADLPVTFAKNSKPVPDHWHTVGVRTAGTSGRAQSATTPAQAIWNYSYAIAEAEITLACHAFGLDPTLGIDQTDRPYRNSLSLDIVEPLRPHVDAHILGLLHERRFDAGDFTETRQGVTRVNRPLTHELITASAGWRTEAINRVRHTASLIVDGKIRVSGAKKKKNNQPTDPQQRRLRRLVRTPPTNTRASTPDPDSRTAAQALVAEMVGHHTCGTRSSHDHRRRPKPEDEDIAAEPTETTVADAEPTTTTEAVTTTTATEAPATTEAAPSTSTTEASAEADPFELKNAALGADSPYTFNRAVADELLTPELDTATGSWLDQDLYRLSTQVDAACAGIGADDGQEDWSTVASRYDFDRGEGTFSSTLSDIYSRQRETYRAIRDWYRSGADRELALILGSGLDSPESGLWPDFDSFIEWFATNFATIEEATT